MAFFFMILSVINCPAEEKTLVAAADPWPPFVDKNNPTDGLALEIIRAAYATQGYAVKMEYVPWARAENGVKEGKFDILPDTWMTEKRKAYLFYSEPYAFNKVKFIKAKGDPFEFNGLASLEGKTIGIVRDYGYGDEFLSATNFRREEVVNIIANIKKLTADTKRIDLTLEDEIVARSVIVMENPELLEKIEFTQNSLSENALHVTSGLENPRHKEIIDAFNKGLAEIKANGTYARTLANYCIK
jgi:polar amino acid transport system substrate-binding protein